MTAVNSIKVKPYFKIMLLVLIAIVILVNASGMLVPILRNDDPVLYAAIAKHIVNSHDWVDLIFSNNDWLDKPHFPFWIIAVSFKIFGINSFAYILPGFLFNLLGAYYTYSLAKYLYNANTGLLAALIFLSSLHILLSSVDVRAEAYLVGEIMGAAYYWLKYNEQSKLKYLFLGALFSALALMTKGLFSLVTITSGLITLWIYQKKWWSFNYNKWLIALLVTFILITPELYCLYLQFDAIPTKVVFGHTHVSGIKWFFWDSQFGRFFNDGPITKNNVSTMHYFFFIHTFLWSFLPWSVVFIGALWLLPKSFKRSVNPIPWIKDDKAKYIYLLGSFIPTFVLFSLTSFQLDYYTNILMPFAAILSARWLCNLNENGKEANQHPVIYFQISLALILMLVTVGLNLIIFKATLLAITIIISAVIVLSLLLLNYLPNIIKAIIYPTLAILMAFTLVMQIYDKIYAKYDMGYQIANLLNQQQHIPIIDYQVNSLTLEFYSKYGYLRIDNINTLKQLPMPYYLVIKNRDLPVINQELNRHIQVMQHFYGTTIDKVMANLFNQKHLEQALTNYVVIIVKPE